MSAPAPLPLLVDCDTGIDDAIALLFLAASPEARILGVSCVAGNVELRHVVPNTLAVLELAGRGDIEVAAGSERPLVRPLRTAGDTHGPAGLGHAALPTAAGRASERSAAELIADTARARPGSVTLLTLGPLTNVALALRREPGLPRLLRGLVMMAGAYRVPGNTAPTMEWNAGWDPEALAEVLAAWAAAGPQVSRPVALGLDVTEQARVTPASLAQVAAAAEKAGHDGGRDGQVRRDSPLLRFLDDALRFYFEFHERYDGFYGAFVHDALAAAAALDPALVRTRALAVEVELEGRWTTGETVADWRGAWGRGPNLEVAIEADTSEFMGRLIERLGRLAAHRSDA